eukprot:4698724-Lingulodinium_polyedra.AAC.1
MPPTAGGRGVADVVSMVGSIANARRGSKSTGSSIGKSESPIASLEATDTVDSCVSTGLRWPELRSISLPPPRTPRNTGPPNA